MARIVQWAVATCLSIAVGPIFATAQDAEQGRELARTWCAECHIVAPGQSGGSDAAPPFPTIANDEAYTDDRLKTWLADPHPPMPKLSLSRAQIDSILAYLKTLKQ